MLLFREHDLIIGTSRCLTLADVTRVLPADKGALADAIHSGNPQFVTNPSLDPELSQIFALQQCAVALCLPLMRGMQSFGVLLCGHPDANFFTTERREMLEMVGHQAVIAIQNARLYQDLENEKEHILETQEEARKKLARDLHDGPTQSVSAIAMRINITRKLLEQNPAEAGQ